MKRIIYVLFALLISWGAFAQTNTTAKVDKTEYNFGDISENGGKVSATFTITNTGMYPLVITRVIASCGCTTPGWTKQPIPSGKTGTVTATYDPKNRPGNFTKSITIFGNLEEESIRVVIKGNVQE